jgi:hypothetical protein
MQSKSEISDSQISLSDILFEDDKMHDECGVLGLYVPG